MTVMLNWTDPDLIALARLYLQKRTLVHGPPIRAAFPRGQDDRAEGDCANVPAPGGPRRRPVPGRSPGTLNRQCHFSVPALLEGPLFPELLLPHGQIRSARDDPFVTGLNPRADRPSRQAAPDPTPGRTATHTLRCLPLDRLVPSPENVRKTPAERTAFAELKASIAAHGLIENLLVRAAAPDDDGALRFEVVAGARRLTALQALADDGAIAPDPPVPVPPGEQIQIAPRAVARPGDFHSFMGFGRPEELLEARGSII